MNSPLTPTVHLNGTSGQCLLEGWTKLRDALDEALLKTRQMEFNPRDYYPRGTEEWARAQHLMNERVAELNAFLEDVREVVEDLDRVMAERNARKANR